MGKEGAGCPAVAHTAAVFMVPNSRFQPRFQDLVGLSLVCQARASIRSPSFSVMTEAQRLSKRAHKEPYSTRWLHSKAVVGVPNRQCQPGLQEDHARKLAPGRCVRQATPCLAAEKWLRSGNHVCKSCLLVCESMREKIFPFLKRNVRETFLGFACLPTCGLHMKYHFRSRILNRHGCHVKSSCPPPRRCRPPPLPICTIFVTHSLWKWIGCVWKQQWPFSVCFSAENPENLAENPDKPNQQSEGILQREDEVGG